MNYATDPIVLGIDIGTSQTGAAYMCPPDSKFFDVFNTASQVSKVPSILCTNHNATSVIALGIEATSKYQEALNTAVKAGTPKPLLFHNFKMDLFRPEAGFQPFNTDSKIFSVDRKEVPAMRVYQLIFAWIFGLLAQCLKGAHRAPSSLSCIVTVPVVWCFDAKLLIQDAAKMGFQNFNIPDVAPPTFHVDLLEEPMAAAHICLINRPQLFPNNSTHVLVDAGGGTTDLSLYSIDNRKLRMLWSNSGGPYGSTRVFSAFWKDLSLSFPPNSLLDFQSLQPMEYFKIIKWFEDSVLTAHQPESKFEERIPINSVLSFIAHKDGKQRSAVLETLKTELEKRRDLGILCTQDDDIILSNEPYLRWYDSIINPLLNKVDLMLGKYQELRVETPTLPSTPSLIVVGGFSSSHYFQRRMEETFRPRISGIYLPSDPRLSVVYGAVTMAQSTFAGAISKIMFSHTYGVEVYDKWQDSLHVGFPKVSVCGTIFAKDILMRIVEQNTSYPVGHRVPVTLFPVDPLQPVGTFPLKQTDDQKERHASKAKDVGSLSLQLDPVARPTERSVALTFVINQASFDVTAKDLRTLKTVFTQINHKAHQV